MKRRTVGFGLLALGVILGIAATLGVAAQEEMGTCYASTNTCESPFPHPNWSCADCFSTYGTAASWLPTGGTLPADCVSGHDGCDATAVTFLGFDTPITACNARSVVSGFGLAGAMLAAVGIVVLRRKTQPEG
jgi:hypothetical protein